jgi:mono/diheme cytochrome c family protein
MRKRYLVLATFILLIALVAGCSSSEGGADSGAVTAGEELFNQTVIGANAGCITCHSLEPDVVIVGPSMAAFFIEAEKEGEELGMTAEAFIRQSILDPNAVLAADYPPDTMPTDWEEVLTEEQVDNLVAYLMSLK